MGYFSMVKEGEPEIKIARAMITTSWGGTDAETIENQVTDKLETEIKSLQGLDDFTSATFNSFSIINVAFKAEAPVAESIQELRGKGGRCRIRTARKSPPVGKNPPLSSCPSKTRRC